MKRIPGWLFRAAAFCCILLVLLVYLDGLFWNRTGTAMPFYAEPEQSIDVLFLGSSKANAAVAPVQMYGAQGFTGYVMYSWSQTPWTSYHYLKDAFKTQSPRVVVLEGNDLLYARRDAAYTEGMNSVNNANALLIPKSFNRAALAVAMNRSQTDHPSLFDCIALGRYHANWKTLTRKDWFWPLWKPEISHGKGYGPLYWTESFETELLAEAEPNSDIYPACMKYLQKTIDLAQKEGASVVLVNYPDAELTAEDVSRLRYIAEYCRTQQVDVIDLTHPETVAQVGLDFSADMGDYSHLNYRGAQKFSLWMGNHLKETYELPDHRDDSAYDEWQKALQIEKRDTQRMEIRLASQMETLLQKTADAGWVALVYAWGDMRPDAGTLAEQNAAYICESLEKYGLDPAVFESENASRLWVWCDGVLTETDEWSTDGSTPVWAVPGSVLINGEEISYQRQGFNVVVVDADTGEKIHSITWAVEHDYTAYTR